MLTLAINTASSFTEIALLERHGDHRESIAENIWTSKNSEAEKLLPEIDKLLALNSQKFTDISEIMVVKGPGSFTGLRVGITVANTISYLNKCPLLTIDTFSYWWEIYRQFEQENSSSQVPTALLIFAGRKGLYLSHFSDERAQTGEIINLDQINATLTDQNIASVFGDISEEQKAVITDHPDAPATFIEISPPISFGEMISRTAPERFKQIFTPERIVDPLYVKDPGITMSKKRSF